MCPLTFNVFCGPRIHPREEEAMENLARYIIRASFSQERMTYIPDESKVIYRSKACPRPRSGNDKKDKKFDALEWLAAMCSHVPNKGEQMVRYVKSYLQDGLLLKKLLQEEVLNILAKNAKESLEVAKHLFKENISDLWVIVASYYSMYYYANAVLLKLGYKVGEKIAHKVTADAIIVYARGKLKESFDFERKKRHFIQYKTIDVEKHSKAKTSLDRAKEFMIEMEKLLAEEAK